MSVALARPTSSTDERSAPAFLKWGSPVTWSAFLKKPELMLRGDVGEKARIVVDGHSRPLGASARGSPASITHAFMPSAYSFLPSSALAGSRRAAIAG